MKRIVGSSSIAFVGRILSTRNPSRITLKLLEMDMELMVSIALKKMTNLLLRSNKMMTSPCTHDHKSRNIMVV